MEFTPFETEKICFETRIRKKSVEILDCAIKKGNDIHYLYIGNIYFFQRFREINGE